MPGIWQRLIRGEKRQPTDVFYPQNVTSIRAKNSFLGIASTAAAYLHTRPARAFAPNPGCLHPEGTLPDRRPFASKKRRGWRGASGRGCSGLCAGAPLGDDDVQRIVQAGLPRPKKGVPKVALPAVNGPSTRPNRLTQRLKRAFITPRPAVLRSSAREWVLSPTRIRVPTSSLADHGSRG